MEKSLLRISLSLFILFTLMSSAFSQESFWKYKWGSDLTFSQTSYDNWADDNSDQLNVNWYNDFFIAYETPTYRWRNTGSYVLEFLKVDDQFRKSDDLFEWEVMYSEKEHNALDFYLALSLKTQLFPGYNYSDEDNPVQSSALLDPGFLSQSAGITHFEGDVFMTRIGISMKEIIALHYKRDFLDDPSKPYQLQPGLEFVSEYNRIIQAMVEVNSKLELFSTLQSFRSTDVSWKNYLAVRFFKNLTFKIQMTLLYDRDRDVKRQIKQNITFGIHYAFL